MNNCKRCAGHGLIKIRYQQEEGFDLAACDCAAGQWWRFEGLLKGWAHTLNPRPKAIGTIEDFSSEAELRAAARFTEAELNAKVGK